MPMMTYAGLPLCAVASANVGVHAAAGPSSGTVDSKAAAQASDAPVRSPNAAVTPATTRPWAVLTTIVRRR